MRFKQPLVSVIVPVYNGEKYLAEAIESIIKQNYQPLEIIIVDDGSTDKTAEIARQFQEVAHYVYQKNSGPSTARNRGIKLAKGELIAFLDADDLWVEGILPKQIDYLQNNSQVEIVKGRLQNLVTEIDPKTKVLRKKLGKPCVSVHIGSAVYRKSVFEKIGLFDENLRHSEDVDFLVRIRENQLNLAVIDAVFLLYRRHKNSLTSQYDHETLNSLQTQSWFRILKKNLDQRRQQNLIKKNGANKY